MNNNHYHILERTIELTNEIVDDGAKLPFIFCPLLHFAVSFDVVNMIEGIWYDGDNFPNWVSNLIFCVAFIFTIIHWLFLFWAGVGILRIFVLSY